MSSGDWGQGSGIHRPASDSVAGRHVPVCRVSLYARSFPASLSSLPAAQTSCTSRMETSEAPCVTGGQGPGRHLPAGAVAKALREPVSAPGDPPCPSRSHSHGFVTTASLSLFAAQGVPCHFSSGGLQTGPVRQRDHVNGPTLFLTGVRRPASACAPVYTGQLVPTTSDDGDEPQKARHANDILVRGGHRSGSA